MPQRPLRHRRRHLLPHRTNGDDLLIGTDRADRIESPKGDDVVRCGDGYDVVPYNKGEDKVAADCEELYPYR
jgi:hypothetical protein